ncbi:hypothetical protein AMJ57_02085 [Parcubacteria bacterium SG8_24]|nr:MAG: hypothetical protein AMJ57_02085 [Parcubacteria bacterium SG8_24]
MRIGIDCRTILDPARGSFAGIGHYTYYLVRHLLELDKDNHYVLFVNPGAEDLVGRKLGQVSGSWETVAVGHVGPRIPLLTNHVLLSSLFGRQRLDLLHGPANVIPLLYSGRAVVTVHDLAVFDYPEWFPERVPGADIFSRKLVVPRSVRHAERIIAVSRQTKWDLIRLFSVAGSDIDVVHEGGLVRVPAPSHRDASFRKTVMRKYSLERKRYALFLGTLEPRKNVEAAVRAFVLFMERSRGRHDDAVLVIAGKRGWKAKTVFETIRQANAALGRNKRGEERVRYVGYVSPKEKRVLLHEAKVFIFPSYFEGFGLPVMEALQSGTPVVCSRIPVLEEICGEAAVLVNPYDDEDIAEALLQFYNDDRFAKNMAATGQERGALFSWDRTARETIRVYERAAGTPYRV